MLLPTLIHDFLESIDLLVVLKIVLAILMRLPPKSFFIVVAV